jgi:hypothetical protein
MAKASKGTQLTKAAMLVALEKCLGVVTDAAKKVGINRTQHYDWINKDPKYAARVEELDNLALDFAESKLHAKIKAGDTTAIIFFLKTKGKKRGYVERQEIVGGMNVNWTEEKTYETDSKADQGPGLPGGPGNE